MVRAPLPPPLNLVDALQVKDVNSIAVCNGSFFGGGMQVSPTADPKDGLLDVTIWAGYNVLDFAMLSGQIYSGKHIEQPKTQCLKCRFAAGQNNL